MYTKNNTKHISIVLSPYVKLMLSVFFLRQHYLINYYTLLRVGYVLNKPFLNYCITIVEFAWILNFGVGVDRRKET